MSYPEAEESDCQESGNMKINSGRGTQSELKGEGREEEEEEEKHEGIE